MQYRVRWRARVYYQDDNLGMINLGSFLIEAANLPEAIKIAKREALQQDIGEYLRLSHPRIISLTAEDDTPPFTLRKCKCLSVMS